MTELNNKARLRWACRRGMLELDVLLMPFVEDGYDALTSEDKVIFQHLLTQEDPELFAWFMGHETAKNPQLNYMVKLILNRVRV